MHKYKLKRERERERTEWDSNPDLCDAGAVPHPLSYQANWGLVVRWVDDKPEDYGYIYLPM